MKDANLNDVIMEVIRTDFVKRKKEHSTPIRNKIQLAEAMRLSVPALRYVWVQKSYRPTIQFLIDYADAVGASSEELFSEIMRRYETQKNAGTKKE
ncbi:MAG: hypothetical protein IJ225_06590 [Solobacterium sp.]|nr:hypothetical protein [Solobacterium sp.]